MWFFDTKMVGTVRSTNIRPAIQRWENHDAVACQCVIASPGSAKKIRAA